MGFEEKTLDLLALLTAHMGALLQLLRWYPDHPLLSQCTHLLLMPLTKREKGLKEAKALKVLRKEKSPIPRRSHPFLALAPSPRGPNN